MFFFTFPCILARILQHIKLNSENMKKNFYGKKSCKKWSFKCILPMMQSKSMCELGLYVLSFHRLWSVLLPSTILILPLSTIKFLLEKTSI